MSTISSPSSSCRSQQRTSASTSWTLFLVLSASLTAIQYHDCLLFNSSSSSSQCKLLIVLGSGGRSGSISGNSAVNNATTTTTTKITTMVASSSDIMAAGTSEQKKLVDDDDVDGGDNNENGRLGEKVRDPVNDDNDNDGDDEGNGSVDDGKENSRNPLLTLLKDAGYLRYNSAMKKDEIMSQLPSWDDMTDLYGPMKEPIIVGTETCEQYRATIPHERRFVCVAGMFNTGTNAMAYHLRKNLLNINHFHEVPWTKHIPPSYRYNLTVTPYKKEENAFPVVIIRDPYHWQQSMCKANYTASWFHTEDRCPNLVPTDEDRAFFTKEHPNDVITSMLNDTFIVRVQYLGNRTVTWNSLVDVWSDYYRQYFEADFPRLIVRFEDMITMAPKVLKILADCVGATTTADDTSTNGTNSTNMKFQYQKHSSKSHGSHSDFISVLSKTANKTHRLHGFTNDDLNYASIHLDHEIMNIFQYVLSPPPSTKQRQ